MGDVVRLGIVVGLPQEAAVLRRSLWYAVPPIVCSGSQPARAAQGAGDLIAGGAEALLSFGFAGGLDQKLRPGEILVASRVVAPDLTVYDTDAELRQRLCERLKLEKCRWSTGPLAGADHVVASVDAKRALAERTSALAVDMESHAVAQAARGHPFAVLRVVIDPAEGAIPSSVLDALQPDGRVSAVALIGGLLRRPSELGSMWRLARDNVAAGAGIGRAAAVIGRAFRLV